MKTFRNYLKEKKKKEDPELKDMLDELKKLKEKQQAMAQSPDQKESSYYISLIRDISDLNYKIAKYKQKNEEGEEE